VWGSARSGQLLSHPGPWALRATHIVCGPLAALLGLAKALEEEAGAVAHAVTKKIDPRDGRNKIAKPVSGKPVGRTLCAVSTEHHAELLCVANHADGSAGPDVRARGDAGVVGGGRRDVNVRVGALQRHRVGQILPPRPA
jgi:hypothetical protein